MTTAASNLKPRLAVIDYGMGNLRSVVRAWAHEGADVQLINEPSQTGGVDALVFPGQGAIVDAMRLLKATGFDNAIRDWIAADKPFFGICLGLQALFDYSEEGETSALGIFKGEVRRFDLDISLKIPHMGWNEIVFKQAGDPVAEGIVSGVDQFYFVHSYHVDPADKELVLFETDYGGHFVSGIRAGNCYATQFHPEKSQAKGLQMYRNFLQQL